MLEKENLELATFRISLHCSALVAFLKEAIIQIIEILNKLLFS